MGFRAELLGELALLQPEDAGGIGEHFEDRHLRNVANAVQERLRRGGEHLDPNRREVPSKEVHF